FHSLIFSQTDCSNIGFELGNISGWSLSRGTLTDDGTKTVYGTEVSGADHKIVNISEGYDAKITQDKYLWYRVATMLFGLEVIQKEEVTID
ncbi:hypothetical protein BWI92_26535, partial [Flectobacillus sp. BAB-3569]